MRVMQRLSRTRGQRPATLLILTAALGAMLFAACAPASEPSGDVRQGSAANAIDIVAEDGAFKPGTLDLESGQEVTVQITNADDKSHDFAIEELDLNTGTVEAGEVSTATFTVPEDSIEFVCTFHSDMGGRIEVS